MILADVSHRLTMSSPPTNAPPFMWPSNPIYTKREPHTPVYPTKIRIAKRSLTFSEAVMGIYIKIFPKAPKEPPPDVAATLLR